MNNSGNKKQSNPMIKAVITFLTRMVKPQEEYPVKYYKREKSYYKSK